MNVITCDSNRRLIDALMIELIWDCIYALLKLLLKIYLKSDIEQFVCFNLK